MPFKDPTGRKAIASLKRRRDRYRAAHRETIRERDRNKKRAKRGAQPEEVRAYYRALSTKLRATNPRKARRQDRDRRGRRLQRDEAKVRAYELHAMHARRARLLGAEGSHTIEEWIALCVKYGYRCAYCFVKPRRLTIDHVVALVNGGSNAIENIAPACHTCNSSKGAKNLGEWLDL